MEARRPSTVSTAGRGWGCSMFFTWHKVADPTVGWLASKTTGWTADSFSGGLEVDFSAVVPVGTKAVRVAIRSDTTSGYWYWRKSGDSNISNTPNASSEYSHGIAHPTAGAAKQEQYVIWLSSAYKADFAVTDTGTDLYIAYPVEWLG